MEPEVIELYCPFCEDVTLHEAEEEIGAECLSCGYVLGVAEYDAAISEIEIERREGMGKRSNY